MTRQVWGHRVVILGLLAIGLVGAATKESVKTDTTAIDKKLDQILANQQTILSRFDAVMEELRIIKVRSTR